jgi:hypothetical protein
MYQTHENCFHRVLEKNFIAPIVLHFFLVNLPYSGCDQNPSFA